MEHDGGQRVRRAFEELGSMSGCTITQHLRLLFALGKRGGQPTNGWGWLP
jgi:hypothetical protein